MNPIKKKMPCATNVTVYESNLNKVLPDTPKVVIVEIDNCTTWHVDEDTNRLQIIIQDQSLPAIHDLLVEVQAALLADQNEVNAKIDAQTRILK